MRWGLQENLTYFLRPVSCTGRRRGGSKLTELSLFIVHVFAVGLFNLLFDVGAGILGRILTRGQ